MDKSRTPGIYHSLDEMIKDDLGDSVFIIKTYLDITKIDSRKSKTMKEILLTNKNIALNDNGVFVFDIRQNRKMRYKILAWLNGEHGEEIILSNAIQEALRGCARTGKDIAFDVRDFSQFGYNFSYLNSVFEHVAFEECKEEADRIERAIFFNITIC